MKIKLALAICGLALTAGIAAAQSPEERQAHLQRWIAEDIQHHRIVPHDASRLEHDMDKLVRKIDDDRRKHHGRLTEGEWADRNRDMDKIEGRLREAERLAPPPRYNRFDNGTDRDWRRDW
jgi:hypothetical protein